MEVVKRVTSTALRMQTFASFTCIDPVIKESEKERSQRSISKREDSAHKSAIF